MYPQTELLFPPRLIPELADLRGKEWAKLVRYVAGLPETHPDVLAFLLMVTRITDCLGCQQGSYRAWRGCAACATLAVARFKGSDAELLRRFREAQEEIREYLGQGQLADAA